MQVQPEADLIIMPRPSYTPDEVVRIQLDALKMNDDPHPNAGAEVAFVFASPRNKANTGPLPRFITMLKTPMYEPLLNHVDADFWESVVNGREAIQTVILTTRHGYRIGYRFQLSRQTATPYQDCWMTDAVIPFEVKQSEDRGRML